MIFKKNLWENIRDAVKNYLNLVIAYPFFLFVIFLGLLPAPLSLKIGELLGNLSFLILPRRRHVALFNIDIAVKGGLKSHISPEEIARAMFINLGRSVAEISMLYCGRLGLLKKCITVGFENFLKAKEKGRGVLFFTGHCGNWELTPTLQGWHGQPVSVVVRPLDNIYINRIFETVRERFNNKVIHKKGALKKILKTVKQGGTVGILIDQSVSRHESVVTQFFGQEVLTTRLLALIALKTNAVVLPAFINYQGRGRHTFTIGKEIPLVRTGDIERDIVINTQNFTNKVQEYIQQHPTEWLWLHRRWKLRYGREY